MPKINWKFLKKPVVIVGAIVLFFIVLWFLNRGASSSGSTAITAGGQDPNVVAANTQLALAGISAGVANNQTAAGLQAIQEQGDIAVALKTIDANTAAQNLTAQRDIAALSLAYQSSMFNSQNQLTYNVSKMAYDSMNYQTAVNAGLQGHLADVSAEAFKTSAIVSAIGTAKKGDRDQLTAALIGATYGEGVSYGTPGAKGSVVTTPGTGGSITYAPLPLPQTNWVA